MEQIPQKENNVMSLQWLNPIKKRGIYMFKISTVDYQTTIVYCTIHNLNICQMM
jgi:hypothetical protein